MNLLFGDATSQMPTPASRTDGSTLMGQQSPVPSLHLGQHGADSAIPGLDIDPPNITQDKADTNKKEGAGGWISNLVKRGKRGNSQGGGGGNYAAVGQSDD